MIVLGHTHLPMIDRQERGLIINPGSLIGIPGVQTSYSFAVLELPSMAVRIFEVRTGREIRRDPVFLDDGARADRRPSSRRWASSVPRGAHRSARVLR